MKEEIIRSLAAAEKKLAGLRKTNTAYIVISLIASVLATLLAGTTALTGPVAGEGPPAWKWTCGIVAVMTATATVFTGLQKQLSVPERISKASECVGKLRAINFTVSGSQNEEEIKSAYNDYRKVIETYSEFV